MIVQTIPAWVSLYILGENILGQDIQCNPSKADTIGTKNVVRCSEVALAQELVVDHTLQSWSAMHDKALLWTMKDLSTDSS